MMLTNLGGGKYLVATEDKACGLLVDFSTNGEGLINAAVQKETQGVKDVWTVNATDIDLMCVDEQELRCALLNNELCRDAANDELRRLLKITDMRSVLLFGAASEVHGCDEIPLLDGIDIGHLVRRFLIGPNDANGRNRFDLRIFENGGGKMNIFLSVDDGAFTALFTTNRRFHESSRLTPASAESPTKIHLLSNGAWAIVHTPETMEATAEATK